MNELGVEGGVRHKSKLAEVKHRLKHLSILTMESVKTQRFTSCLTASTSASTVKDKLNSINDLIDSLLAGQSPQQSELILTKLKSVIDEFQENPQLMDGQLSNYFNKLLSSIPSTPKMTNTCSSQVDSRSPDVNEHCDRTHDIFAAVYLLTKARGFKSILKHFPHSVDYVLPILELTERQSVDSSFHWESKYILLLWLSILVQVPFDMAKFEGSHSSQSPNDSTVCMNGNNSSNLNGSLKTSPAALTNVNSSILMNTSMPSKHTSASINKRIINVIESHLLVTGKTADAAAYLAARFLSRPDVSQVFLGPFISWCIDDARKLKHISILMSLQYLYKIGKRELMQPYSPLLLREMESLNLFSTTSNQLVIKYCMKLTQQIGLSSLKLKLASWRYQKVTKRFLSTAMEVTKNSSNISNGSCKTNGATQSLDSISKDMDIDTDDVDVPEGLEDVIEILLNGLRQGSTVVRWSAAKGIGRITIRLSRDLAQPILESVLDLFTLRESDSAWHGGCLTLAELGRRGLILPSHLSRVMDVVKDALVFDEFKGCYSVGSHVRNAACYVCWSFARAYDAHVMKPYVTDLASHLLIVALYDREVNVRQAASAAFQEHVGRQGALPEGIEIVTLVDYTSVSSRKACYTQLAPLIAKYAIYQEPFVRHLVNMKVGHWDSDIRSLAAQSLLSLVNIVPTHLIESIAIPKLISMSEESNLNERNGALIAIGSLVRGLSQLSIPIPSVIVHFIKSTMNCNNFTKYSTGFGSENTRSSICQLINCISISSNFPLDFHDANDATILKDWQSFLLDLLFIKSDLRFDAINTLPHFALRFIAPHPECMKNFMHLLLIEKLPTSSDERNVSSIFEFFTLLPFNVVSIHDQQLIVKKLVNITSSIKQVDLFMPLARASAVKCLAKVILESSSNGSMNALNLDMNDIITNCLINCCNDYTCSSERGDISLIVRDESLIALRSIVTQAVDLSTFSSDLLNDLIAAVLTLSVSHQVSTRSIAIEVLDLLLPSIGLSLRKIVNDFQQIGQTNGCLNGNHEILSKNTTASSENGHSQMIDTEEAFLPLIQHFLPHPTFGKHIWIGIIPSVGCKTVSIANFFQSILSKCLKYYTTIDENYTSNGDIAGDIKSTTGYVTCILAYFGDVFQLYANVPRMAEPLLNTLDFLLTQPFFDDFADAGDFCQSLLQPIWSMISKSNEPCKKIAGASVISKTVGYLGKRSLGHLAVLLCSPKFPRVRIAVAEILTVAILTWPDKIFNEQNENIEYEDKIESILNIISETDWSGPVAQLKVVRNQLCSLLGLKPFPI